MIASRDGCRLDQEKTSRERKGTVENPGRRSHGYRAVSGVLWLAPFLPLRASGCYHKREAIAVGFPSCCFEPHWVCSINI